MKTLVQFFIILSLFFVSNSYSYNSEEVNPEFMEDEEIDYSSNSKHSSIETEERSQYELDIKNYASARYISTKTTVEYN